MRTSHGIFAFSIEKYFKKTKSNKSDAFSGKMQQIQDVFASAGLFQEEEGGELLLPPLVSL